MTLFELLQEIGIRHLAGGEIMKGLCPFHDHKNSRTFWVRGATGSWGCWSERCMHHSGGTLPYLLYLQGWDWSRAHRTVKQLELRRGEPTERTGPQDFDQVDKGRIQEKDLVPWKVNWFTVDRVCDDLRELGADKWLPDLPLHYWCETIAKPGSVEHAHWQTLGWATKKRRVTPATLQRFGICYDPDYASFVFPLRRMDNGKLEGVGRRHPAGRYITTASRIPPGSEGYTREKARTGQVLWGLQEHAELVAHGAPLIITEGYFDVLHIADAGWAAVAKLRAKLSQEQVDFLRQYRGVKILWPDLDKAGLHGAAEDLIRLTNGQQLRVVTEAPLGTDPGDLTPQQIRDFLNKTMSGQEFLAAMPNLLARAKGAH